MATSRFERVVLGLRDGLGEGLVPIRLAGAAAARRRGNWVLPGLLGAGLALALLVYTAGFPFGPNVLYVIGRIILFDYLVFFFGWLCGWNAAWRWRRQQVFIEDLAATNLRPTVVGHLLFAGSLAVWWRVLAAVAVIEALFHAAFHLVQEGGATSVAGQVAWALSLPAGLALHVAFLAVLAWFHLESLRIAYWMFAVAALPRFDLRSRAIGNLVIVGFYVVALTAVGSVVTGLLMLPAQIVYAIVAVGLELGGNTMESHVPWMTGALAGMLVVGYLKRQVARLYEQDFARAYLMFTWWGAAEIDQPANYPPEFVREAARWTRFHASEEQGMLKPPE